MRGCYDLDAARGLPTASTTATTRATPWTALFALSGFIDM
jgi:hypothetical protein